jgi:hypothetical protein
MERLQLTGFGSLITIKIYNLYTLNQLTQLPIQLKSTNVTGLTAGNYEVVVTSARACFNSP